MKKKLVLLVTIFLVLSIFLSACGQKTVEEPEAIEDKGLSIMLILTGSLGDLGLGDMVNAALKDYADKYNGELSVFECAYDASLYEPSVMDIAESGKYDLIVTGFYNMKEAVEHTAVKYPDQKFLVYDVEMDYTDGKNKNVVSVQSKQNEGAFLAGVIAALMTTSGAEFTNPEKIVGYVGAAENTAILDFLVGYIDGVKYVDTQIEILYSFVGDWSNTAKAKELGLSQYQQGADVSFSVCGSAGLGVAEAAKEVDKLSIGVDYDYAEAIKDGNLATAEHIMTSAVKDFYTILYNNVVEIHEGTIEWGTHRIYGYAEKGVNLSDNEFYQKLVPDNIKQQFNEIAAKLAAGEIDVKTAIGATQEQIEQFKEMAKPY